MDTNPNALSSFSPDALAGAVERVQDRMKNDALYDHAWVRFDDLRLLLSCAASHVPEADREEAIQKARKAGICWSDPVPAVSSVERLLMAEARKLLRLPSQTEQGS